MRYIFHLSLPVKDLPAALAFYENTLGANIGRSNADWADVLLWGHQITLQQRPEEVLGAEQQGKRHFGVILPWHEWRVLADRLSEELSVCPLVAFAGSAQEEAKFYLSDPSHNVIEVKTYRHIADVLGVADDGYN